RNAEVARSGVGAGDKKQELGAGDLAALAKKSGVPLEKLDPNQLAMAARYVNQAGDGPAQAESLRKALDNLQSLSTGSTPKLTRDEMKEQLWAMAKVPGHAL